MPKRTFIDEDGNTVVVAILQNWVIGPTRMVSPNSEVIQWILDAHWYNFEPEHRYLVTMDIEATKIIKITPVRLGVWLQFALVEPNCNRHVTVFIQLYNNRVMKLNCFNIQTYEQIFAKFFADLVFNEK